MAKMTMKAARVNVGLNQKEAAKVFGVSNTTLCKWENGESFPKANMLPKICTVYRVNIEDIIFLPNNPL